MYLIIRLLAVRSDSMDPTKIIGFLFYTLYTLLDFSSVAVHMREKVSHLTTLTGTYRMISAELRSAFCA